MTTIKYPQFVQKGSADLTTSGVYITFGSPFPGSPSVTLTPMEFNVNASFAVERFRPGSVFARGSPDSKYHQYQAIYTD